MPQDSPQPNRHYELVSALTPDQVKLHGLFQEAAVNRHPFCDAALVLHGLSGNFYNSSLNLRLADALRDAGIAVVLANNRGHDGISMNPVAGRAQTIGAAYELVDDCKLDVAGWIQWLNRKGFRRVLLVGHSLGAIKALYAQAHLPQPAVVGMVGLSATRLCFETFLESPRAADFQVWVERSKELISQGSGQEMIHTNFPFPVHMTAAAWYDKYGPANRYDWIRFADRVTVPVLLMYGERELSDNPAFHGLLESTNQIVSQYDQFQMQIIESANHFYAGVHHRAVQAMMQWLECQL